MKIHSRKKAFVVGQTSSLEWSVVQLAELLVKVQWRGEKERPCGRKSVVHTILLFSARLVYINLE